MIRRHLSIASEAWREGDYSRALGKFRQAAAAEEPGATAACAKALAALGEIDAARQMVDRADDPQSRFLAIQYGIELRPLGETAGLLRRYAAEVGPYPMALLAIRALALIERGGGRFVEPDARAAAMLEGAAWTARHLGRGQLFGCPAALLRQALTEAPTGGLCLEFGVFHGRSIRQLASRRQGPVHGFDSFQGLPEQWTENDGPGAYTTGGRLPSVPGNVTLHPGWFDVTIPPFLAGHPGAVDFAHIDCDLYSSSRTALTAIAPRLRPGSMLLFDDLLGYPGYQQHELRAFNEVAAAQGWQWEVCGAVFLGREVAIRLR